MHLVTTTEAENKVKRCILLDRVVLEGAVVLKLLAGEDKTLLIWWDSLLVLDLRLDVVDGVSGLNLKSDSLASKCLNEDLHIKISFVLKNNHSRN